MSFLVALTFLTVIPLARRAGSAPRTVQRAMLWFPAVGLLIGVLAAGVLWGAVQVFPVFVPEIVAVVFLVVLTGALHLDGLADTFDGLFGGHDREARLRIMKDTNVGTFGVAAIVCLLLLKVGLVAALGDRAWATRVEPRPAWLSTTFGHRWVQVAGLTLMPVWGRWVMTVAAAHGPYARVEGGTGAAFVRTMGVSTAAALGLIPFGLSWALWGWAGVVAGAAAAAVAVALHLWWRDQVGGVTGDTMGALGEVSEAAFLLAAAALLPVLRPAIPY